MAAAAVACVTFGIVSQTLPGSDAQTPATRSVVQRVSAAELSDLVPPSWGSVTDAPREKTSAATNFYTIRHGKRSMGLAVTVRHGVQEVTDFAPLATVDQRGRCAPVDGRLVMVGPWGNELSLCHARFDARNGARLVYELFASSGTRAVGVSLLTANNWTVQIVLRPAPFSDSPWISTADLYTLAVDPRLMKLAFGTR